MDCPGFYLVALDTILLDQFLRPFCNATTAILTCTSMFLMEIVWGRRWRHGGVQSGNWKVPLVLQISCRHKGFEEKTSIGKRFVFRELHLERPQERPYLFAAVLFSGKTDLAVQWCPISEIIQFLNVSTITRQRHQLIGVG